MNKLEIKRKKQREASKRWRENHPEEMKINREISKINRILREDEINNM